MIYFFLTDKLFLIVLALSLAGILLSLRRPHNRQAYRQIFKKPLAVSASILFIFFLLLAVLDSIHLQTNNSNASALSKQNNSLLDILFSPLDNFYEKTYSAPLALNLFNPEIFLHQGKAQQIFPPLNYPKHITNRHMKWAWIFSTFATSFIWTFLSTCLLWYLFILIKKIILKTKAPLKVTPAQKSAFVTIFCCLFVLVVGFCLSRELHVLGTGKIGEDIFYYTIKSIRTGLVIGILTTLLMMPLAIIFGILAGYFGGWIDDLIQYLYTVLSSIPGILLITAAVLSMQTYIANHPAYFKTLNEVADARLLALCLILGITSWTSLCRLLRAEALKLREIDYVTAAKVLGSSAFYIMRKHLLPNVMHIVLISLVLDFSFLVLAEAVLSYVGVGVSPMTISWGNMINGARLELAREPVVWWPILSAFVFMFVLVLASNILADAVRDAFDPRHE